MKKTVSIILAAVIALSLSVSASAASLYDVMFKANAGESIEGFTYDNYLNGLVIPDELKIEFDLTITGDINPYATIFCFHNGDGNARLCFTLGGGLIFNDWAGNWFDAGLHESIYDNIFEPYIGSTVRVRIVVDYEQFGVYLNDEYAYGSDTLTARFNAADAFYGSGTFEDYWDVSTFVCQSTTLDFGYNSWWTSETLDVLNAEIADFALYLDGNLMAKYFVGGEVGVNEFHEESEYITETEPPETEPETTVPPETESDTDPESTDAPATETEPTSDGGCGASVTAIAAIVVFTSAIGCAVVKKH